MEDFILTVCHIFQLLAAAYGLYFVAVSLFLLKRDRQLPEPTTQFRFAVLIPARNEESCIAGIIQSIRNQDYPTELIDIYVIPNNCTDQTEFNARNAGAQIIPVSSKVRSKGQALHEAFAMLLTKNTHDAYCVFDADNELHPSFLKEMNRSLHTSRAAKSRIFAKNAGESWVCACYEAMFCNANSLINRPRQKLGLSAHLIGTGFAVRRDLMVELGGWNTETLTEDADFYARLAIHGEHIAFVSNAITYDEEPLRFRESLIQRRRWMSGIMEVLRNRILEFLHSVTTGVGGWNTVDCLLQISFVSLQAWIIPIFFLQLCVNPIDTLAALPFTILSFYCSTAAIGAFSLLSERRMTWRTASALLLYPLFIFSFLPLQTISLIAPNKTWVQIHHTGVRLKKE